MDEVKVVANILQDALDKINDVTGSSSGNPNVTQSSQRAPIREQGQRTPIREQSQRIPLNRGEQQHGRRLIGQTASSSTTSTNSTTSSNTITRQSDINNLPRETGHNLLARAQSNFRSSFPQFYSTVQSTARDTPQPRKRQRISPMPSWIKDTWTHDFVLLSSTVESRTPTAHVMNQLQIAGLGRKKIVFKNKHGGFDHLRETLEKEFPKLETQGGAFELLRADRGGNSRPLLSIPMANVGYTIKHLKEAVSGSAAIYIRPIQWNIDMTPVSNTDTEDAGTVYIQCVSCNENVPLCRMKDHASTCKSDNINEGLVTNNSTRITAHTSSEDLPKSEVETIVVDENISVKDFIPIDDDFDLFPTSDVKENWTEQLQAMFPDAPKLNIESSVNVSLTLQEAAEILCDGINDPVTLKKNGEEPLSDLLLAFGAKIMDSEYMLTVEREEVWSGALAFYKKALLDKKKLWQDLTISFKGEEGLDAGAIKTEFFELLLREINFRLFEGQAVSQLPVRDSSKAILLKLAGVAISHSIIQRGPAFSCLSPAVFSCIAGCDADIVASHIHKDDVPRNAGTANLHNFLEMIQETPSIGDVLEGHDSCEAFWALINASHWSIEKKIDDQNVGMLVQHLLENEIIYSRKLEIDAFAEGLEVMGLLKMIRENPTSCRDLLCYNTEMCLTAEKFISHMLLNEPTDYSEKQSYDWFLKYVNSSCEDKLKCMLQFVTGHRSMPPRGLLHRICLKFLPNDEKASLPKSMACLGIIHLPTVYSSEKKFMQSLDIALKWESEGFTTA